MRRIRKNKSKTILLILTFFVCIGFAYLSTSLSINGLGMLKRATWDVYFDNITYDTLDCTVNEEPEIEDKTTINFNIMLNSIGSSFTLQTDVVNNGSIDAMIESFEVSGFDDYTSFIDYTITYKDGVPIENFNLLAKNSSDKITLKVKFKEDISVEDLPTNDGVINATININYQNATNEAQERDHNNGLFVSGPDFRDKIGKVYGGTDDQEFRIDRINTYFETELPSNLSLTEDNLITIIDDENGYTSHGYIWGSYDEDSAYTNNDCIEYDDDDEYECIDYKTIVNVSESDLHFYLEPGTYFFNEDASNFFQNFIFDDHLEDFVSDCDSSLIQNASYMFSGALADELDLSSWNTSNVENMSHMFSGHYGGSDFGLMWCIGGIDVSNFDTSNVTDMSYMFAYNNEISFLDLSSFYTSNVTNFEAMFLKDYLIYTLRIPHFSTDNAINLDSMFCECSSLASLNVSNFNVSKCRNFSSMFKKCYSLYTLDVSNWDPIEARSLSYMFSYLTHVSTLAVSGWTTNNVTSISGTFSHCEAITSLDLSGWNVSNTNGLFETFTGCYALTNLNLSGWDTSNATTFQSAFSRCRSLTTLDLSSFNTSNVTQAYFCFSGCTNLTTIYVSNLWDFTNVQSGYDFSVFNDCTSLVGGNGTVYDSSYTRANYARIDGKNGLPGYLTLKT